MIEIVKFAGMALMTLVAFGSVRVAIDLFSNGEGRIREVREEGGGVVQKARGVLDGGQRRASSARAHGLHIEVEQDGTISWGEKSVMAKEVA